MVIKLSSLQRQRIGQINEFSRNSISENRFSLVVTFYWNIARKGENSNLLGYEFGG